MKLYIIFYYVFTRPGKTCALCNLGERSMLGQGELMRFEIPNGFDPHSVSKGLIISSRSEKDNSSDRSPKQNNFSSRRIKGAKVKYDQYFHLTIYYILLKS